MCTARSSSGGSGRAARATRSAVEAAPPLKATHTREAGKPGSSSASRALSARGPNATLRRRSARATASGRGLGKHAEGGDLGGARGAQLLGRDRRQLVQVADHGSLQAGGGGRGVAMRASEWLLDDLVHQSELVQAGGGGIQRLGRH